MNQKNIIELEDFIGDIAGDIVGIICNMKLTYLTLLFWICGVYN